MSERLDWIDPTRREWDCTVVWSDPGDPGAGVAPDRSALYPAIRAAAACRRTTACRVRIRLTS